MDSKVSEKDMREVYFQAFGKEYDSADRKQAPLPLEIAYLTALNKLKREGKYAGGGEITDDAYYQSVNHFVYFCMNYQNDFLDAFGSLKNHLSNKFKDYYNKYGTYGVMIHFYTELDSENRRILTDYSLKNYKGTPISSDISDIEYFNSVNHFIYFCFNFPSNFMDAFSSHLKVHLSSKWTNAYEKKGSVGAMIYFWSELDNENRRKLADWVRVNYTGTRLYEVGGALGDVAGMLPSPLPMSTIQAMADGGQLELFADGGGVGKFPPKGELTNKDNFLLKYEKKGSDYEFFVYKPITKEVSGYNQIKHVCLNKDCPQKMTYEQFINYLYVELYLDDNKYSDGGGVDDDKSKTLIQSMTAKIFDDKYAGTGEDWDSKMFKKYWSYSEEEAVNKLKKENKLPKDFKYSNGGGVDYYELQDLKNKESVLEKELHQISDNQSDGWRIDLALVRSELESVREEISKLENKYADGGGVKTDYFIAVNNRMFDPYQSYYRVESSDIFNGKQVYYDVDGEAYTIDEDNYSDFKSGDNAIFGDTLDTVISVDFYKNDEDANNDYYDDEYFINNTHKHVTLIPNFNKYYGEWHKDKSDAEKELKSLENKFSDGGGVDVDKSKTLIQSMTAKIFDDKYAGTGEDWDGKMFKKYWSYSEEEAVNKLKKENKLPKDFKYSNGGGVDDDSKFINFKKQLIKYSDFNEKTGDGFSSRYVGLKNKKGDKSNGEYLIEGNTITWVYIDEKGNEYISDEVPEFIIDLTGKKESFNKGYADGGGVGEIKITKNEVQFREDEPHRVYHWYEGTLGRYVFYAQTDNSFKGGYGSDGINKGSIYKLSIRKVKENGMHESIAEYWNKWDYRTKNVKDGAIRGKIIKYLDSISDERIGSPKKYKSGGGVEVGDVVEVKEPNYGRDRDYYVVADKVGYDKDGFLISDVNKREGDVFEEEQLEKLFSDGGLIAPNGKPSKLTPEQYKLVRSSEFKAWFGDWENDPANSSKVIDKETKEPLVLLHGTNKTFSVFKKSKNKSYPNNVFGFFLTTEKWIADSYGKNIIYCFLNLRNPTTLGGTDFQIHLNYRTWDDNLKLLNEYKKNKLDGIFYTPNIYVAFEPEQIKLADGTNTTFDSNNPDIRFDDGGGVDEERASRRKVRDSDDDFQEIEERASRKRAI